MKISIVIPVYNAVKTLPRLLRSLQRQTYKNIEILFIDNNSSDNSLKFLKGKATKDKRIKTYIERKQGPNYAREKGFKKATGDYIYFCDSDDELDKNALKSFVKVIEKTSADVVIGDYLQITSNGEKHMSGIDKGKTGVNLRNNKEVILCKPCLWNKIFKKELIDENLFVKTRIGEDMVITLSCMARAKKIYYTNDIIYKYYFAETGLSSNVSINSILDIKNTCISLKEIFVKDNNYSEYKEEIDFTILSHIIYRIMRSVLMKNHSERELAYNELSEYFDTLDYKDNKYYKKKPHYRLAKSFLLKRKIYFNFLFTKACRIFFTNKTINKFVRFLDK